MLLTSVLLSLLEWTVGYSFEQFAAPETYHEASVPGNCQLDIAKALDYPDYTWADNYKKFSWMEDVYFTYKTVFDAPSHAGDERVWFCSKGIDYEFEISLNGELLLYQEGMFTPVNLDITDKLKAKGNELKVLIYKAPKSNFDAIDRTQANHSAKPPVSYGWDWHPRLIVSGIYDETGLEIRKKCHLSSFEVTYGLNDDFSKADIRLDASAHGASGKETMEWTMFDMEGKAVASKQWKVSEVAHVDFANPALWWTHDHGTPYLYTYKAVLKDKKGSVLDTREGRIGFRRIRLVMNEGAWDEPYLFPKSRSNPPAQFELNGRNIFAKGTNWLAPDIFIGRITADTYNRLLDLAVGANMNALRCWGGCAAGKDSFFELCDEKGILVWQEFPLSCNAYPDDADYLRVLSREAESIIRRIHPHPCLALWCGGNELFNNWSLMDDQSLALRTLNSICLNLSPEIPFNPTSPLGGMAHGCYLFDLKDDNVFSWMDKAHNTAFTEFGMPGVSCRKVLESIIPENELFPPAPGGAWEEHHAFNAWGSNAWLDGPTLDKYFGKAADLDELILNSQTLQCIGYKLIYEQARRKKPYCAMALNWCYNEPWPAAVNNSLITYPAIVKPALDAVGESLRPVCASAVAKAFCWKAGEAFKIELAVLNDSYDMQCCRSYKVRAWVLTAEGSKVSLVTEDGSDVWTTEVLEQNRNAMGPEVSCILPQSSSRLFTVHVEVEGFPGMNSDYQYAFACGE